MISTISRIPASSGGIGTELELPRCGKITPATTADLTIAEVRRGARGEPPPMIIWLLGGGAEL
jgi:hypothetical protein